MGVDSAGQPPCAAADAESVDSPERAARSPAEGTFSARPPAPSRPARVLLISLNRCTAPDPVFPIGLAYLNAALREAGHLTRWVDLLADGDVLEAALTEFRPDLVGLSLRNIDDVLILKKTVFFGDLAEVVGRIRAAHPCPIVLGGSGFSIFPERLLALSQADFGIRGEGEESLLALLAALRDGGDCADVPGLVRRHGDAVIANPCRPSRRAPCLAGADRPAASVDHYLRAAGMLNVQTQRGCAHACCYCTYPLLEGAVSRRRPPEEVAHDFAQLEAQGARYVFVVDSIFNSSPQHVMEICDALERRRLKIEWGCFLRPQGLSRDLLARMRRAGLAHVEFGSDSFCDAVLAEYGKRLTFADIRQSHEAARAIGVDACHFLICGGPGETPATLDETLRNSLELPGAIVMAMVGMRVYPGTALERRARREGLIAAGDDLLAPSYYVAPGLTADAVFATLRGFSTRSPNWIVGDPVPEYDRLIERLRRRGVVGPLWSYLALAQRIRPGPAIGLP